MLKLLSGPLKMAAFAVPLSPMLMAHAGSGTWEKRGAFALTISSFLLIAALPLYWWLPLIGLASWGGAFWCGTLAIERQKREVALDKEWKRWEKIARKEEWKQTARNAAAVPGDLIGRAGEAMPSRAEAAAIVNRLRESVPALPFPSMRSKRSDTKGSDQ